MEPFAASRVCLRSKVDPKSPAGWCGSDTDDGKVWRSEALELEASSRSRPVLGDVPIFFSYYSYTSDKSPHYLRA